MLALSRIAPHSSSSVRGIAGVCPARAQASSLSLLHNKASVRLISGTMKKAYLPICMAAVLLVVAAAAIPAQAGPGVLSNAKVAMPVQRRLDETAVETAPTTENNNDQTSTDTASSTSSSDQPTTVQETAQTTEQPDGSLTSNTFDTSNLAVIDVIPVPLSLPTLQYDSQTMGSSAATDGTASNTQSTDDVIVPVAMASATSEPLTVQTLSLPTTVTYDSTLTTLDTELLNTLIAGASQDKTKVPKKPQCEVACEKDRKTCQKAACNRKGNKVQCKQQCETVSHRCVQQCQKNAARHTCFGTCDATHTTCGSQCQTKMDKKQTCFTQCSETQTTCSKKCKGQQTCQNSCNTTQNRCQAKCALEVEAMKGCWGLCDTTQNKCNNKCNKIH